MGSILLFPTRLVHLTQPQSCRTSSELGSSRTFMCVYIGAIPLTNSLRPKLYVSLMEAFERLFLCMGLYYISIVMKHVITKFMA